MKIQFISALMLSLAAAALAPLSNAGPTGAENFDPLVEGQQPPYMHYCKKKYFTKKDGKLYCNWGRSFGHACEVTNPADSYIYKASVTEEAKEIGRCPDDTKVLRIKHH